MINKTNLIHFFKIIGVFVLANIGIVLEMMFLSWIDRLGLI